MEQDICKLYFDRVKIWGADITESIMADEPPRDVSPDLYLHASKNSAESGQFIMTSENDFPIPNYQISVSDLINANNLDKILSSDIEIFNQKYIKVVMPSVDVNPSRTARFKTGFYPDALIPFENAIKKVENRLDKNFNQGIWVNVNVPETAANGIYTGKIAITVDKYTRYVNIILKVYDCVIPYKNNAQSMFAIWYDLIQNGENKATTLEVEENYYNFLVSKRINPTAVPELGYKDYKEFANYIVKYAKDDRVNKYRLPAKMEMINNNYVANLQDVENLLLALCKKQIELIENNDDTNLFSKGIWYTIDEPDYGDNMHLVPMNEKIIVQAKENVCKLYPNLESYINSSSNIMVTQRLHTDYAGSDNEGGIQTWCVQVDCFDSDNKYTVNGEKNKSAKEFLAWRLTNPDNKQSGENFWWYCCNKPENPYPNFMLDDNLIASRLLMWMQYKLGIQGCLSWCVNYFKKFSAINTIENRNIWVDPATVARVNGEGYLLYPGEYYGLDTPISTLRLENIRQGNQDYELFLLLDIGVRQLNKKYNLDFKAREIISYFVDDMVRNNVIPIINGNENETFKKTRVKLLELISLINFDNFSAKCEIQKIYEEIRR